MSEAAIQLPKLVLTAEMAATPEVVLSPQQAENEQRRQKLLAHLAALSESKQKDASLVERLLPYQDALTNMGFYLKNLAPEYSHVLDPVVIEKQIAAYESSLKTIVETPMHDPEADLDVDTAILRRRKEAVLAEARAKLEPLRGKVDRATGESLLTDAERAGLQSLGQIHLHYKKWEELLAQLKNADEAAQVEIKAKIDTRAYLLKGLLTTVEKAIPKAPHVNPELVAAVSAAPIAPKEIAPTVLPEPKLESVPEVRPTNVVPFPKRSENIVVETNERTFDTSRYERLKRIARHSIKAALILAFVTTDNADKTTEKNTGSAVSVGAADAYAPIPRVLEWTTAVPEESMANVAQQIESVSQAPDTPTEQDEKILPSEPSLPLDTIEEVLIPQPSQPAASEVVPVEIPVEPSVEVQVSYPAFDAPLVVTPPVETLTPSAAEESASVEVTPPLNYKEQLSSIDYVDAITQGYRVETAFFDRANALLADLPETLREGIIRDVYSQIRTDRELQQAMGLVYGDADTYFIGESVDYTKPFEILHEKAAVARAQFERASDAMVGVLDEATGEGVTQRDESQLPHETIEVVASDISAETVSSEEIDSYLNQSIMKDAGKTAWQDAPGTSKAMKICEELTVGDMTKVSMLQGAEFVEACRSFGITPSDFRTLYTEIVIKARDLKLAVDGTVMGSDQGFLSNVSIAAVVKAVYKHLKTN